MTRTMNIEFEVVPADYDVANGTVDRIRDFHLQSGEAICLRCDYGPTYSIRITVPVLRAPEVCAELIREGYLN